MEILTFHRIVPDNSSYFIPPMALAESTFTKMMKWLKKFRVTISLEEATERIAKDSLCGKKVALTFDDGYRDNFDIAANVLKKLNIPATFFIPVHPIDSGEPYWWDALYHHFTTRGDRFFGWIKKILNEFPPGSNPLHSDLRTGIGPAFCRSIVGFLNGQDEENRNAVLEDLTSTFGTYDGIRMLMDWDEIRALKQSGFSIGSHTISHTPLTDLTPSSAHKEIQRSKRILEERVGSEIAGFSYPRGQWNEDLVEMVTASGYRYAVTTAYGSNRKGCHSFLLTRRNISDFQGFRSRVPVFMHLLEFSGALDIILKKRRTF